MVTRDDLFREIDYVRRYLVERDLLFDSALLLRFTRMRAIAATLLPERIEWIGCGYGGCRIRFRSEGDRREHRRVVHWLEDEEGAAA